MEKNTLYIGVRMDDGCIVVRSSPKLFSVTSKLDPRYDLVCHSPDGFNWGYSGSGPAQLALAICADVLSDDNLALQVYQEFKDTTIAGIKTNSWMLPRDQILKALDEIITKRHSKVIHNGTRI